MQHCALKVRSCYCTWWSCFKWCLLHYCLKRKEKLNNWRDYVKQILHIPLFYTSLLLRIFMKKSLSKNGTYFCYEMYPQKGFWYIHASPYDKYHIPNLVLNQTIVILIFTIHITWIYHENWASLQFQLTRILNITMAAVASIIYYHCRFFLLSETCAIIYTINVVCKYKVLII